MIARQMAYLHMIINYILCNFWSTKLEDLEDVLFHLQFHDLFNCLFHIQYHHCDKVRYDHAQVLHVEINKQCLKQCRIPDTLQETRLERRYLRSVLFVWFCLIDTLNFLLNVH